MTEAEKEEITQEKIDEYLLENFSENDTGSDADSKANKKSKTATPAYKDAAYKDDGIEFENCTDMGNARRLAKKHGNDIRYCHAQKKWFIWDGKRWKIDSNGEIVRRAKDTVRSIYAEAMLADDDDQRERLAKWAMRSETESKIKSMISLAESEPGIPVSQEDLDKDDFIINTESGTIDLRTADFYIHRQEDLITKLVPTTYDLAAEAPIWNKFLDQIMDKNKNLIEFIQKAVGYSLTGDTSEQVLFILFGEGANGKSTFIDTIRSLLEEYSKQADFSTFLQSKNDAIRNDLARLAGVRFVSAVEVEKGRRLSESVVKQVTGQDVITARFLHQEFFEFKPKFKIFLAVNHKPKITGIDHAIWRRIRLIPFTVTIPDDKQDKDLPDKLKKELPGILAWAVEGCLRWQAEGLGYPDEVKAATEEYKAEMDVLADYIAEYCVVSSAAKAQATALYNSYREWAEGSGEKPFSQKLFGTMLSERGFDKRRGTGGRVWWYGIGLRDERQQQTVNDSEPCADNLKETTSMNTDCNNKVHDDSLLKGII